MTRQADTSGALALSPRPGERLRPTSPSADSRSVFRPAAALDAAHTAEVAQARLFERLLRAELAELQEHAHRITGSVDRATGSGAEPGVDLLQIRARLDEVEGLLRALRGRFPESVPAQRH